MKRTPLETGASDLAALAVETTRAAGAEEAEAVAEMGAVALTRFANNRIHQNVAEQDSGVSIRAVVDDRVGVASTNRTDPDGLRDCGEAAVAAALASRPDPSFPGLPEAQAVSAPRRAFDSTRNFDADARARAVRSIVDQSASRDLIAAGAVKVVDQAVAVLNSRGVAVATEVSGVRATVLSTSPAGGTGWASYTTRDAERLAAAALGDEAATLAERSDGAGDLPAGEYTVVLAPEAVADIVEFLGWLGCSAKAVDEGRSFLSGRQGERIMSESVTLVDDAAAAHAFGLPFDFEGQPARRTVLIDRGVAGEPVTDSYWAARLGTPNTGHALPAPNPHGPLPLHLELAGGDATIDELIAEVKRGVYVTRFHYVNVEDPVPTVLTGMTRDGTFLIENGHLTAPLKSLRFTQGMVAALGRVRGVTKDRSFIGSEMNPALVPGLLIDGFAFTGRTE